MKQGNDNQTPDIMNVQQDIDLESLAEEIIESEDIIKEYGVSSSPARYFPDHTDWLMEHGKYFKCRSFIIYYHQDLDELQALRAPHRSLIKLLTWLDNHGHIDIGDIRNIERDRRCSKCYGKGFIPGYEHVQNGVCFKCGGSGYGK